MLLRELTDAQHLFVRLPISFIAPRPAHPLPPQAGEHRALHLSVGLRSGSAHHAGPPRAPRCMSSSPLRGAPLGPPRVLVLLPHRSPFLLRTKMQIKAAVCSSAWAKTITTILHATTFALTRKLVFPSDFKRTENISRGPRGGLLCSVRQRSQCCPQCL